MKKAALALCLGLLAPAMTVVSCDRASQESVEKEQDAETIRLTRARAMIDALMTADPAAYEAAAQENYSTELFARRTSEERTDFVRMIASDLGRMSVDSIVTDGDTIEIAVAGDSGVTARFVFEFDDTPEQKIARIGVTADQGERSAAEIPSPEISAEMGAAEIAAGVDAWLAPVIEADDFAGVILIAQGGAPLMRKAYGLADRDAGRAADMDTAYNIASIGKKFTQVAIARLIEEERLSLETKIAEVIPDYPNDVTAQATVKQLIDMEGGVADFFGPGFKEQPKNLLNSNHAYYQHVSAKPPNFAPGERREYCNGCYVVLGEIIERVEDEPFEAVIQRVVFDPAGMKRSGYFNAQNPPENVARLYGRADGPGSRYIDMQDRHGDAGSGAGGAYSTADDLLKFDNALREGRLLNGAMTVWTLGGGDKEAQRNRAAIGVAGGSDGTNALLYSNGEWAVIVTANVSEPLPEQLGVAIGQALMN